MPLLCLFYQNTKDVSLGGIPYILRHKALGRISDVRKAGFIKKEIEKQYSVN